MYRWCRRPFRGAVKQGWMAADWQTARCVVCLRRQCGMGWSPIDNGFPGGDGLGSGNGGRWNRQWTPLMSPTLREAATRQGSRCRAAGRRDWPRWQSRVCRRHHPRPWGAPPHIWPRPQRGRGCRACLLWRKHWSLPPRISFRGDRTPLSPLKFQISLSWTKVVETCLPGGSSLIASWQNYNNPVLEKVWSVAKIILFFEEGAQ